METAVISERVRRFIVENYFMASDFTFADGDSFLAHGIIDSTGILELVGFLQETYGITMEDEELIPQNLDSVSAVSAYVGRKLNGSAAPVAAGRNA
jgi:acyl carrier protein